MALGLNLIISHEFSAELGRDEPGKDEPGKSEGGGRARSVHPITTRGVSEGQRLECT